MFASRWLLSSISAVNICDYISFRVFPLAYVAGNLFIHCRMLIHSKSALKTTKRAEAVDVGWRARDDGEL